MMELINEAYNAIQRAPLRYFPQPTAQASRPENRIAVLAEREPRIAMDRLEFWVRFVCGAILGIFISAGFALKTNIFFAELPSTLVACVVILIVLACGFGAARGGDRFWYAIFGVGR